MTTQLTTKRASQSLFMILIAVCCGAAMAQTQPNAKKVQYQVSNLASLGGTSSGGNSINDQSGRQVIPDCRIGTGTLRCGETVR